MTRAQDHSYAGVLVCCWGEGGGALARASHVRPPPQHQRLQVARLRLQQLAGGGHHLQAAHGRAGTGWAAWLAGR